MLKFKSRKRAFTLIELLIVIAIIGILFIVLVSKVDFATDKAKATGVQTDFRSFQVAFDQVAKENAGFNIFGWDTGDVNGDHIRNSYDRGDTNKNGKEDAGETFIGRKEYGETWTTVYTMLNPDATKADDTSAFEALERAINANLDPKLHITITPDVEGGVLTGNATITMANQSRDPWKNEYHGVFITNAVRDNGADRGAIIIYSDGANGVWGSAHDITNGVVSVSVPGNNVAGQDDYAMVSCYTYVHGFGEVVNNVYGFAPNYNSSISNNVTPDLDDSNQDEEAEPDDTVFLGGLYDANGILVASWETLVNDYGMDATKNYTSSSCSTDPTNPAYILNNTAALQNGVSLVINNVETIGNYAFYNCSTLTSVVLGVGVKEVVGAAFWKCTNLQTVSISSSMTKLTVRPFLYCSSLSNITVHEDNPIYASMDGVLYNKDYSVLYQYPLGNVRDIFYLPDTVSTLETCSFSGAKYLKEFVANETSNLEMTKQGVFESCSKLTNIVLPEGLKNIDANMFYNCSQLTNVIIPTTVTVVGTSAFQNCSNLRSITLPCELKDLQSMVFYGCNNLTSINIPYNLTTIPSYCFAQSGLQIITFDRGSKMSRFDEFAFYNAKITSVYWYETMEQYLSITMNNSIMVNGNFYLNDQLLVDLVIPTSLTTINRGLGGCASLQTLSIHAGVNEIMSSAFKACGNLTTVTIATESQLSSIPGECFRDCKQLSQINIPDSVVSIGNTAFYQSNLQSLVFGVNSKLETIGSSAFSYSKQLSYIVLPKTLKSLNGFSALHSSAELHYQGTVAEWNAISKDRYWRGGDHPLSVVYCTDGQVDL